MHLHIILLAMTLPVLVTLPLRAEPTAAPVPSAALQQYVAAPDDSYGWRLRREGTLGSGSYVELTLTSQTWRDIPWKHQLFIYRPTTVAPGAPAVLLIEGGRWSDALEQPGGEANLPREAQLIATLSENLRAPVAVLLHVPHQPIFDGMIEDEIISFTFEKFLRTGDADWPLLLPMVKSAVRAMDAVQEFANDEWELDVEAFLVTGASKRGWTTWLTAAVDERVTALAPMVIDMLNMAPHMELQRLSYGTASEQIRDYTDRGLHEHLDTERGEALRTIVDPYSYRDQVGQPKLIILGTNDRYWPLDALNLYWDDLNGEKYVLYVPNNGHGLRDYPRVLGTLAALHHSLNGGPRLPKLEWTFDENEQGTRLMFSADVAPASVSVWTATAATRDFRDAIWEAKPATPNGDGGREFVAELPQPAEGYAAVFAEAQFNGQPLPFYLSTNIRVVPADQE